MQRLPERVLQWLYSSLSTQYEDVDRTYTDVVKCLSEHPSLSPRTDVHTFDNGRSALLLVLQGTLAVPFRGNTYHFPTALWVPYAYPRESPMMYVIPTENMAIRPGQHVSVEGRIYHPYLAHWKDHWKVSNLVDALSILRDVFAKEPPVVSRQQQQPQRPTPPPTQHPQLASPPPVPKLPDELRPPRKQSLPPSLQQSAPPPPPPKPPEASASIAGNSGPQAYLSRSGSSIPPSLPPKPHQSNGGPSSPTSPMGHQELAAFPSTALSSAAANSTAQPRNSMSSPTQPPYPGQHLANTNAYDPQRRPPLTSPPPPPPPPPIPYTQQAPQPHYNYPPNMQHQPGPQLATAGPPPQPQPPIHQQPLQIQPHPHPQPQPQPQARPPGAKPIEDLLSGPIEALQAATPASPKIAPPIPPNPEKDYLLTQLTTQLSTKLNQSLAQNQAAAASLEAQNAAMRSAYAALQAELGELQALDGLLASNEKILLETMREGDRVMESMKGKNVPNVDDVLVAPTVVGEQLYGLVADDRAIGEAMFALTRALDSGRVEGDCFVKQTRTLAREQFLKKALIKKIARGMGLAMDG